MARGADAQPRADAANRRVRRRHVRIGAVVDVEERALRALEHDRLPFPPRLVEEHRHVGHPPAHPFPAALEIVVDLLPVHRRFLDQPVAGVDVVADGFGERVRVGEVADAHAAARDLVLVGRADAAGGRADLALAAPRFAEQVELAVVRQDEVRLVADDQAVADRRCRRPRSRRSRRTSACGSMTTPLPMMHVTPWCRIPDGSSRSTNLRPLA